MSNIKVDNNIPTPAPGRRDKGFVPKYPFKTMLIGQSFFVAGRSMKNGFPGTYYNKFKGRKFTARNVIENGVNGVRVWRVK